MPSKNTAISNIIKDAQSKPEAARLLEQLTQKAILRNAKNNTPKSIDPNLTGKITFFTSVPGETRGDFYAAQKLIKLIKESYPHIEITWLVVHDNIGAPIPDTPGINQVPLDELSNIEKIDPALIANSNLIIGYPSTNHFYYEDIEKILKKNIHAPFLALEEYSGNVDRLPEFLNGDKLQTGVGQNALGVLLDESLLKTSQQPKALIDKQQILNELLAKVKDPKLNKIINNHDTLVFVGYFNKDDRKKYIAEFANLAKAIATKKGVDAILLTNNKELKDLSQEDINKGKNTFFSFNPYPLEHQKILELLQSDIFPIAGCTGDQSFIEILQVGLLPFYQIMSWKQQHYQDYIDLAKKITGDASLYVELLKFSQLIYAHNTKPAKIGTQNKPIDLSKLVDLIINKKNMNEILRQNALVEKYIEENFDIKRIFLPYLENILKQLANPDPPNEDLLSEMLDEHINKLINFTTLEIKQEESSAKLNTNNTEALNSDSTWALLPYLPAEESAKLLIEMIAPLSPRDVPILLEKLFANLTHLEELFEVTKTSAFKEFINAGENRKAVVPTILVPLAIKMVESINDPVQKVQVVNQYLKDISTLAPDSNLNQIRDKVALYKGITSIPGINVTRFNLSDDEQTLWKSFFDEPKTIRQITDFTEALKQIPSLNNSFIIERKEINQFLLPETNAEFKKSLLNLHKILQPISDNTDDTNLKQLISEFHNNMNALLSDIGSDKSIDAKKLISKSSNLTEFIYVFQSLQVEPTIDQHLLKDLLTKFNKQQQQGGANVKWIHPFFIDSINKIKSNPVMLAAFQQLVSLKESNNIKIVYAGHGKYEFYPKNESNLIRPTFSAEQLFDLFKSNLTLLVESENKKIEEENRRTQSMNNLHSELTNCFAKEFKTVFTEAIKKKRFYSKTSSLGIFHKTDTEKYAAIGDLGIAFSNLADRYEKDNTYQFKTLFKELLPQLINIINISLKKGLGQSKTAEELKHLINHYKQGGYVTDKDIQSAVDNTNHKSDRLDSFMTKPPRRMHLP